jgi:hypothetical protein
MLNSKLTTTLALCLSIAAGACSAEPGDATRPAGDGQGAPGSPAVPAGETGSVGMQLVLAGGAQVPTVSWAISGPNGTATIVQSGTVDVHESGGVTFTVPNIPAGSGYRVVLSALSVDGGVSCEGSATFAVIARTTTNVGVQLACNAAGSAGLTTVVNGTSFNCAAWNSVTASPIEVDVGASAALTAAANGPIAGDLTYQWSAHSGQFSAATSSSTSFTCTAPGPVVVTLVVGDGPVPAGSTCNSMLDTDTITVTCTGSAPPPPPPPSAPALPPWGPIALALGMIGIGYRASRRPAPPA